MTQTKNGSQMKKKEFHMNKLLMNKKKCSSVASARGFFIK